jgi:hypothetical protein
MANAVPRAFNHWLTFDFQRMGKTLPGSIGRARIFTRQKLPLAGINCLLAMEIFAQFESK